MAQYTPNHNLGKPDASDPFGDFRQLFNDNMDKIDQMGGGGGSGGHTIVDADGNSLPQEDELQFTGAVSVTDDAVNGRTVINVVACKKVTQAEYDALPASKLTDNIAYFIVDGESDEYKAKADKSDLASIQITGTVNDTGSTIASGTYFYLNGTLVRAIASISNGATLTLNTNYEKVTAGALNEIKRYAYKNSGLLTFNVSNYVANANLSSNVNIDKDKIVCIQPINASGWSTYSINFMYYSLTGDVILYTNVPTASNIRTQFRVFYEL